MRLAHYAQQSVLLDPRDVYVIKIARNATFVLAGILGDGYDRDLDITALIDTTFHRSAPDL